VSTFFGLFFIVMGILGLFGTYFLFMGWNQVQEYYKGRVDSASAATRWLWWRPWPSRSRWFQLLFGWGACLFFIMFGISMLVG
jgi:hypothetical protein